MAKQVVLEPEIHAKVKTYVAQKGTYINIVVNRAVERFLRAEAKKVK